MIRKTKRKHCNEHDQAALLLHSLNRYIRHDCSRGSFCKTATLLCHHFLFPTFTGSLII